MPLEIAQQQRRAAKRPRKKAPPRAPDRGRAWSGLHEREHFVQFYDEDAVLVNSVAAFIGAGVGAGEGAVVIATPAHREAIATRLAAHGIDLDRVSARGQYIALDAADTISKFIAQGTLDHARFHEIIADILAKAGAGRPGVRVFGEMVALLWADGDSATAIHLEELWNELAKAHSFRLFCAYPLHVFPDAETGEQFKRVCQEHSRVLPSEDHLTRSDAERLREIASLQQKAVALQSEVARRQRAEDRLQLYYEIFAGSKDGIAVIGTDGAYIAQNHAHAELLGYTDVELIGKTPAVHLGDEVFAEIVRALRQTGRFRGVVVSRTRDRRQLDVDLSAFAINDEAGRVSCYVGIKRDITDRKRVEQALARRVHEQTALYEFTDRLHRAGSLSDAYDAAVDAILEALGCQRASILLFDDSGVMRFVGWRGLSDSYRTAVEGHSPWLRDAKNPQPVTIDDIHLADIPEPLKSVVKGEGIRALAFIPLVVNGSLIGKFMTYYDAPHTFARAELDLALTVARQLGFGIEQKRGEQQLRRSELRLRTMAEALPNLLWTDLPDGQCDWLSSQWGEYTGFPEKELLGLNWLERVIHPEDRERTLARWRAACEDRGTFDLEYRIRRHDGEYRWFKTRGVPVRDEQGRIVYWFGTCTDVEDIKQAERRERALIERTLTATAKFHAVFSQSPIFAGIMDIDGILLEANDLAVESCGYTREEVLNRPFWETPWWRRSDEVKARIRFGTQQAAAGNVFRETIRYWIADGTERIVDFAIHPIRDEAGAVLFLHPTGIDVTERTRAEEDASRLAAIVQHSDDAIFSTDLDGIVTSWNRGAQKLYGYTADEAIGHAVGMLVPEERDDEEPGILEHVRRGEPVENYETVRRRKDGTLLDVSLTVSPLKDGAGNIIGASKIARDITDRKRAMRANHLLSLIVESSDDAIASKDLDGIITSWNKGAERMFGYAAEEVIGKSVTILMPPERVSEEPVILERIRRGERIDHYETVRRRKDGTLFEVSLTVSPIKDVDGRVIGASKVARDITDVVRAREKLERTVAERTAQLRDTVAELEAFSYSVAHDMRAPLRAMTSYARFLEQDFSEALPADAREFVRRIGRGAQRLDVLITDVLNYSKIVRGEMALQKIDVEKLTRDIIDSYPDLRESGATILVQSPIPPVMANTAALTQCISNLLSNAIKFVGPGVTPQVRIRADRQADRVRLWFEDNGIGISREGQQRIFRMFQRLNPATEFEGTGIGLTIVRKAVERMGGKVGVESEPGHGSRFWIELKGG